MKLIYSYLITLIQYKINLPLSRKTKQFILLLIDILLLFGSILISFSIFHEELYWPTKFTNNEIIWYLLLAPVIGLPIFYYFGLYRAIIRYPGLHAALTVFLAVSLYSLVLSLLITISGVKGISNSVLLINLTITLLSIGGSRAVMRDLLLQIEESIRQNNENLGNRALIIGAGVAARQLALGLIPSLDYQLYGFVDDKKELHGLKLMGLPILSFNDLPKFVSEKKISDFLMAMPSISRTERNIILQKLYSFPVRIRTLPGLIDIVKGKIYTSDIQYLDIDDLLMRQASAHREDLLENQVKDKVVLVTGGGGSIGSEISRQVLKRLPKILILLELNEYALYSIHQELQSLINKYAENEKFSTPKLIPLLGSVQDQKRISKIFDSWKPNVIYHAAAYKHVPIVEENIVEGIQNNVFGTFILVKTAIEYEVSNFVFISSDKAVNPTNIMGASKRIAEMTIQSIAQEIKRSFKILDNNSADLINKTNFSIVRFGNVLNSSGSVIPLFRKQIQEGGPITITDVKVERFFMTIEEAAQLVMYAASMSSNTNIAEVFVLNMGEPVKIMDLAYRMVKMFGLRVKDKDNPEGDISIKIIGLRPGEKLYEELLIGNNTQSTQHNKILKANEEFLMWDQLEIKLNTLKIALEKNDLNTIFDILQNLVKGYKSKNTKK